MPDGNGIKITHAARFLKSARKLPRNIKEKLRDQDTIFRQNPFDSRLNAHKLHGRFQKFWAYSVNYQYRVIFIFTDTKSVTYYDVGPHDIYGKDK